MTLDLISLRSLSLSTTLYAEPSLLPTNKYAVVLRSSSRNKRYAACLSVDPGAMPLNWPA
uniref:Uncharacterized protein n=1 Tax=Arundo donax TaxID=35708 RepID=A0A0A8YEE3_ARUDO